MNKLKSNWDVYKLHSNHHHKPNTPKQTNLPFEDNFKIYLRVKPQPHINYRNESIKILSEREIQIIPPYFSTQADRVFEYEQVFGQAATNEHVFSKTMEEPIRNVLSGYNSTVFIYGMTGAGKTYTMFNSISQQRGSDNQGIVGLAINRLFQEIRNDQNNNFQVFLSFFQIYNENIRDLLCESSNQQQLNIMEDPIKGIFINQLTQLCVEDSCKARRMIEQCLNKRSINATKNNQYSSRSHAILHFVIKKYIPQDNTNQIAMHQSKLFLIDLAGNEKAGQNESKRFVQGININKSLLTLGKCINILSQQKKPTFIPYRDSKLTRILKDSLGGNSKTVMIACISSEAKFYQQTLNTIKYSTKAKKIQNKGKGASIKLISKKEMPRGIVKREENNQEYGQEKIYELVNHLQVFLEDKVRTQKMREQLQTCYQQNKNQHQKDKQNHSYQANMRQINELLSSLDARCQTIDKKIEEQVKRFIQEEKHKENIYKKQISSYKNKLKEQSKEIQHMRGIIAQQKHNIQDISHQRHLNTTQLQSHFAHSLSQTLNSIEQPIHKISTPTISEKIDHSNFILIHQSNNKSQFVKKVSNISISTSKNSRNKENIFFNNNNSIKRSNTPQSMASSKVLSHLQKSKLPQKKQPTSKPIINISMDNIHIKSPHVRFDSKDTCVQNERAQVQKDNFLIRLKQMDKNEEIKIMVKQYESNNYDLNKMETSMINKLKFVSKTCENKPNCLRKDRSFLK